MKLRKELIIPLAVLVFAVLGLEITGVKLNIGTATFHDTLSSKLTLNKGLNVNGVLSVNGSAITGGSVITASEEGSEIEGDMTGINFAGNLFTATTSSGAVTLTANLDTTKIATLNRSNTFTNTNTFNGQTYTGAIETGNTTVTGTFDVTTGVATFGAAINLVDNTKVITASGSDILYKVTIGGAHKFQTSSGTTLANIDSATGFSSATWAQLGPSAPVEAVKLVRFKVGAPSSTTTAAHGLDHNTIIGWTCTIRDDTTNTQVNPQSWYSPWVYYAKIESLNVSVVIPASPLGNSVANDSALFRIVYRK